MKNNQKLESEDFTLKCNEEPESKKYLYDLKVTIILRYLDKYSDSIYEGNRHVDSVVKECTFKSSMITDKIEKYVILDDTLNSTLKSLVEQSILKSKLDFNQRTLNNIPNVILYGATIHIEGISNESDAMKLINDKSSYVHQCSNDFTIKVFNEVLNFIEYDYSFINDKILETKVCYHGVSKINTLNHQVYRTQLEYIRLKDKVLYKDGLMYKVEQIPSYNGLVWYEDFVVKPEYGCFCVETLMGFIVENKENCDETNN